MQNGPKTMTNTHRHKSRRPFANRSKQRTSKHVPTIGANRNGTPMLVGKIKIEPAGMLSDADTDRPLGTIKLRARFEQIERRCDHRRARCGAARLVVATPHPSSETFAANGPSFAVAVRYEIGECDAAGSVKYLLTERHLLEHIVRPQAGVQPPAPGSPDSEAPSEAV